MVMTEHATPRGASQPASLLPAPLSQHGFSQGQLSSHMSGAQNCHAGLPPHLLATCRQGRRRGGHPIQRPGAAAVAELQRRGVVLPRQLKVGLTSQSSFLVGGFSVLNESTATWLPVAGCARCATLPAMGSGTGRESLWKSPRTLIWPSARSTCEAVQWQQHNGGGATWYQGCALGRRCSTGCPHTGGAGRRAPAPAAAPPPGRTPPAGTGTPVRVTRNAGVWLTVYI